jgi:hypothetical protein
MKMKTATLGMLEDLCSGSAQEVNIMTGVELLYRRKYHFIPFKSELQCITSSQVEDAASVFCL